MTERAAFFDLERTLTPHAVEQEVARALWRTGALGTRHLLRVAAIYVQYDLGLLGDFEELKRRGAVVFTDRPVDEDRRAYDAIYRQRLAPAIYPGAKAELARLRAEGHAIYIVSSTYAFMVDAYAKELGVDGFYGVTAEARDGRFTGRLEGRIPHQQRKAEIVRELARDHGYALSACAAYGDSLNDLPMLEAVGRPHAVNPARGLRREAEQRGWPILSWR